MPENKCIYVNIYNLYIHIAINVCRHYCRNISNTDSYEHKKILGMDTLDCLSFKDEDAWAQKSM